MTKKKWIKRIIDAIIIIPLLGISLKLSLDIGLPFKAWLIVQDILNGLLHGLSHSNM